jgi:hypothetical protein
MEDSMAAGKKIPQRQCVGCREMKDKKSMLRIVKTPENTFCVDSSGRKNGRGAYICSNGECLKKAIRSKGLERTLKAPIPEEIYAQLLEEMKELDTK